MVRKVGIVMGSDSDLPVIQKATNMLKSLDIPFEVHVYSAHRTPEEARAFAVNARKNGFGVLIAAAGMAAHLAGAIADPEGSKRRQERKRQGRKQLHMDSRARGRLH